MPRLSLFPQPPQVVEAFIAFQASANPTAPPLAKRVVKEKIKGVAKYIKGKGWTPVVEASEAPAAGPGGGAGVSGAASGWPTPMEVEGQGGGSGAACHGTPASTPLPAAAAASTPATGGQQLQPSAAQMAQLVNAAIHVAAMASQQHQQVNWVGAGAPTPNPTPAAITSLNALHCPSLEHAHYHAAHLTGGAIPHMQPLSSVKIDHAGRPDYHASGAQLTPIPIALHINAQAAPATQLQPAPPLNTPATATGAGTSARVAGGVMDAVAANLNTPFVKALAAHASHHPDAATTPVTTPLPQPSSRQGAGAGTSGAVAVTPVIGQGAVTATPGAVTPASASRDITSFFKRRRVTPTPVAGILQFAQLLPPPPSPAQPAPIAAVTGAPDAAVTAAAAGTQPAELAQSASSNAEGAAEPTSMDVDMCCDSVEGGGEQGQQGQGGAPGGGVGAGSAAGEGGRQAHGGVSDDGPGGRGQQEGENCMDDSCR